MFVPKVLKVCRQRVKRRGKPEREIPHPSVANKDRMTKSAQNDPEVHRLLKRCEELGYPIPLPEKWGAERAKKNLRLIIECAGGTDYCPVCKRKIR